MRRIFWGFCINWFLIDPLHYLLSRSDFGVEFAEILVIKSPFECLRKLPTLASRRVIDPTQRVGESPTPRLAESGSRHGESGSRYSNFFKFSINSQNFEWSNQPFKGSIWQKKARDVVYHHH
jgi:hypothetical protein